MERNTNRKATTLIDSPSFLSVRHSLSRGQRTRSRHYFHDSSLLLLPACLGGAAAYDWRHTSRGASASTIHHRHSALLPFCRPSPLLFFLMVPLPLTHTLWPHLHSRYCCIACALSRSLALSLYCSFCCAPNSLCTRHDDDDDDKKELLKEEVMKSYYVISVRATAQLNPHTGLFFVWMPPIHQ